METLDKKVLSKRKILNALKHDTQMQLCQLEEQQQEFQRLQREDGSGKLEDKKEQEAMVAPTEFKHAEIWMFFSHESSFLLLDAKRILLINAADF